MVDLGFIDKNCNLLESRFFPSKIGGKPAWLDLQLLPEPEEMVCKTCNQPRYFLCQLYCPVNEKDTAFHRTLFVFVCLSEDCFQPNSNSNFRVFRSQLSKKNNYYPHTPPIESLSWRPDINCKKFGVNLCNLCGIKGEIKSSNGYSYCCDLHKIAGENKSKTFHLLPEYGLIIEPEDGYSDESYSDDSNPEEDEDSELNNFVDITKLGSAQNDPTVEQFFSECQESAHDSYFFNFKTRLMENPKQVIRYGKNTKPLWISSKYIPKDDDVPVCEYCGSEREFEFQVLPQLLNYLNLDKDKDSKAGILDWGTLAIYTCKNSCNSESAYKTEFLWKQDLVE